MPAASAAPASAARTTTSAPARTALPGIARGERARGRRRRSCTGSVRPSDAPTFTRICQSSRASPGGAMARAARLHAALVVGVDRVLLDVRGARQHDIGRRRQFASSTTPCTTSSGSCAAAARRDDPRHVADRAVRTRIDHVQRFDAPAFDRGAQRRQIRQRHRCRAPTRVARGPARRSRWARRSAAP